MHDFDAELDRTPPSDIEAEKCILGAMMLSEQAVAEVSQAASSDDFYRPAHQLIYEAIIALFGNGKPTDIVSVSNEMVRRGEIARVGGAPYLHTLIATVPTAANAGYYLKIIKERAILRRLIEVAARIDQRAYSAEGDVEDLIDWAEAEIFGVAQRKSSEDYRPISEVLPETLDEMEAIANRGGKMLGVPTGFADLDALTQGLQPSQLVILAARPAIGKSTAALDIARSASIRNGLTSAFFSLEMSRSEIAMRLLSAEGRVNLHQIRSGKLGDEEWKRLGRVVGDIAEAPLFIDDSPNLSMMDIRAKCRRIKAQHDLQLVVVDYLQLMSSGRRVESRQVEVAEFSRQMKLLAKEMNVPVLALSQLNRGPEQRSDNKPMPSDLRESGALEQDADMVILLHRPDMYDKESPRAGEADLIVAKHRNGPTATVTVAFQGHYSRFVSMHSG